MIRSMDSSIHVIFSTLVRLSWNGGEFLLKFIGFIGEFYILKESKIDLKVGTRFMNLIILKYYFEKSSIF